MYAHDPAPARLDDREQNLIRPLVETGRRARMLIAILLAVCAAGVTAFVLQCIHGLEVTGMRDQYLWGLYITNFVFFIGISHAGTLISAILRVTGTDWRAPITRMAEAITVFALLIGAPMVIIDMGRPDRILNIIIHGRLQSPLLWDVISVITYFCGSLLYLYLPMIPDLAYLRDQGHRFSPWRQRVYRTLSLGWRDTPEQRKLLERAIAIMAVTIIPVAVSVHTVISWIFGMTLRPGWHSTIFGPYFVVGAIFSGIAAILTAMAVFRKYLHLHDYITDAHFQKLGKLLLAMNAIYIYFTFSEYLTSGYAGLRAEATLVETLLFGKYALTFWGTMVVGLFAPLIILAFPRLRTVRGIVTASILVNIGMWLKRFIIVVPTLAVPYVEPAAHASYRPTWVEWTITAAGFSGFALLYVLFSKVFPLVAIWETRQAAAVTPSQEASHA